jgi:hypothetical protein
MKRKTLFSCPIDDVPVIGEFVVESMGRDMHDFSSYSPIFTPQYADNVKMKIVICRDLTRSWTFTKELKAVTDKLYVGIDGMRVKINRLEGYIRLGAEALDVAVADVGLKEVRRSISAGNAERLVPAVAQLLSTVRRNYVALQVVGLQETLLMEIEHQTAEIDALNVKQNELESERNRATERDVEAFNDLWRSLAPILETGKALYRGVDDAKRKDYTIAQLEKRLHPPKRKPEPNDEAPAAEPAGE